jgi:hypothetical protein
MPCPRGRARAGPIGDGIASKFGIERRKMRKRIGLRIRHTRVTQPNLLAPFQLRGPEMSLRRRWASHLVVSAVVAVVEFHKSNMSRGRMGG